MAETINYRFRMRRALAATWVTLNDVLLEGEWGYEKDTGKVKIGDGVTAWNDLGYFAGSGGAGLIVSETAPTADLVGGLEWLDPSTGTRYTYFDDGDSQQWVEFGPETQKYVLPALAQGTTFPLSPGDGQRFYRTDLHMECFYDLAAGEWLSSQEYTTTFASDGTIGVTSVRNAAPYQERIFFTRLTQTVRGTGTNNATNYWNFVFAAYDGVTAIENTLWSPSTSADNFTADPWILKTAEVNLEVDNCYYLRITATRVGSAGSIYLIGNFFYRLIVT